MVRDIIQVPFDYKWYNICFINGGTSVSGEDIINETVSVTIKLNNSRLKIKDNGENCFIQNINSKVLFTGTDISFNLSVVKNGVLKEGSSKIKISYQKPIVYAKPEPYSNIVKFFLVIIAYWAILILLKEIFNLIYKS